MTIGEAFGMLSLWAILTEADVEAYAGTLVLPPYLAHLCLGSFTFARQAVNADGREPLTLTYLGEGRLEEHALEPEPHAEAMIRFICPALNVDRIELPKDDARWMWTEGEQPGSVLRIYFSPVAKNLNAIASGPIGQEAYVSVSRQQVFLGRRVVEAYLSAWLKHLGIESPASFGFGAPAGDIALRAGSIGGQLLLDDHETVGGLLRFAGLDKRLAELRSFVVLDLEGQLPNRSEIHDEGISLPLVRCDEQSLVAGDS